MTKRGSRVTNISKSFTHKMAVKTSWHRYGTNLLHYQWRRQDLVSGGHDDRGAEGAIIEAPSGVGYREGCQLPSRLGGLGSVVSSPSEVRGAAPAAIAFSAYFRSQNASGSKKNTACIKLQRARARVPHAWRRHYSLPSGSRRRIVSTARTSGGVQNVASVWRRSDV